MVQIVPVRRVDWARVAGGLLDPSFYRGEALPTGKGYGWYVQRVRETIDQAYMEGGGEKVLLLGHSAGETTNRKRIDVQQPTRNITPLDQFNIFNHIIR